MNEKAAKAGGHQIRRVEEDFKDNDRSLAEGEEAGKLKMLLDEHEKVIGVQILGLRAGDLIGEWSGRSERQSQTFHPGRRGPPLPHPCGNQQESGRRLPGPQNILRHDQKGAEILFSSQRQGLRTRLSEQRRNDARDVTTQGSASPPVHDVNKLSIAILCCNMY